MGSRSTRKLICGAACWLLAAGPVLAEGFCAPGVLSLRGDFGRAQFSVEVADDPAERAQGLMFRDVLPKSTGMLFVYEMPQRPFFWMKNTLVPLDMIFADAAGRVTRVHSGAVPLDETAIDGGPGVQYVLEINAGLAEDLGLAPGVELRHPAIAQPGAAWRCDAQ